MGIFFSFAYLETQEIWERLLPSSSSPQGVIRVCYHLPGAPISLL